MCICVYGYTGMCIWLGHVYVCICVSVYMCICVYVYMCVCVYVCMFTQVCTDGCVYMVRVCGYICLGAHLFFSAASNLLSASSALTQRERERERERKRERERGRERERDLISPDPRARVKKRPTVTPKEPHFHGKRDLFYGKIDLLWQKRPTNVLIPELGLPQ